MKAFNTIPFFRISIPFIAGIVLAIQFALPEFSLLWLLILCIMLLFLNFHKQAAKYKWLFLAFSDAFLLLSGIIGVQHKDLIRQQEYYGNYIDPDSLVTCVAAINDLPVEKKKTIKCELKILEVRSGPEYKAVEGTVYGYFKHCKAASALKAGETVLIRTKLSEIQAPGNPFEFDYKNYLYNRQIYHTAFIDTAAFVVLPVESQLSALWRLGLNCKRFILDELKNSELSPEAYGICAALLTGYDDDIDRTVMEAFSHSGTLHVLSVSGLHTGLIYLVLNFLFNLVDRKNKYKLTRFLCITIILWFFALITGFSAPVLRAVVMFNLLGFGKIYFRARLSHQLNILLLSAFILLVYNPFYITDIGFLLSYFALFGLLYFQPKISAAWHSDNKILNAVWQSVTASIAATLSTLPITLFCFHQFPLWFIVCNLVVVPATFVLLLAALLVVCNVGVFSVLINYSVAFLIWFIGLFNTNTGYIDNIHFAFADVLFLSLLIILLSLAFQYRSYRNFVQAFLVLIVWQIVSMIDSYTTKQDSFLTVYNIKGTSAVAVKNKTDVYMNEVNPSAYNFSIKPHLVSCNYPAVNVTNFNLVKKGKESVLFLRNPGQWPELNSETITTLVLANNFKLTNQDLSRFRNLKNIVLDASNNSYITARTEELSRNFAISFYSTKYKGAFFLAL